MRTNEIRVAIVAIIVVVFVIGVGIVIVMVDIIYLYGFSDITLSDMLASSVHLSCLCGWVVNLKIKNIR